MRVSDVMTRDVITVLAVGITEGSGVSARPARHLRRPRRGRRQGRRSVLRARPAVQGAGQARRKPLADVVDRPLAVADRPKLEAAQPVRHDAPAVTVEAKQCLGRCAPVLEAGISRLPVLETGLAGIVTRADLVRVFVRSDEEIAREIKDEIVARTLWIRDDALEVRCETARYRSAGAARHGRPDC